MIKVHFCSSSTIVGLLIRLVTFSKWNHVALEISGTIYEADMNYGVRKLPLSSFKEIWTETQAVEVSVPDTPALYEFMEGQLGKKYDFTAILALPFRTNWQHPHKWFCSELVAKALAVGGLQGFIIEKSRITPRDLWILTPLLARPSSVL